MVNAIRQDAIEFYSAQEVRGLFLVGNQETGNNNVPFMPILYRDKDGEVTGIDGIECQDLFSNFDDGDIIWVDSRYNKISTILSRRSTANTLLLTEKCDNRCLFCSQPPNEKPDAELYINAALALIHFDSDEFVGLSGGEPTLNGESFLKLLRMLNKFKNKTPLHILSNGRGLASSLFAKAVCHEVKDRVVLWGIPLYGHKASLHDHLVGSEGAFVETLKGISHLLECKQSIELRIVPTRQNFKQLPQIVEFVALNYPVIDCISIMNLEPKGLARKNYSSIHVSVDEQNKSLEKAVSTSCRYGIEVRLFNYPLCLLTNGLREYAHMTISDWKNYYPSECTKCDLKNKCGGFFTSATGIHLEKIRSVVI